MNDDKLFIIAVGGTGMRCLESFVHLCAIGMFDNKEIDILTLDTDQTNGNKARVEHLIDLYRRVKTSPGNPGGTPNANTFFSAKLNLYRFFVDYSNTSRNSYKNIADISRGNREQQEVNQLISDLFLDPDSVQQFNLSHGYRAQTHLGSYLMYFGIVETARRLLRGSDIKSHEKELGEFLNKVSTASTNSRIFILGSVFGGTGASSIPILPKAFQDFIKIRSSGNSSLDFDKVKFGSTLLTEYFSFNKPNQNQMKSKDNSVIADSSFFPINSQAALQFYQRDPTVQRCYKALYHVGWPLQSNSVEGNSSSSDTITGGANQKNNCHIVEMLCACAAYDFFNREIGKDVEKAQILYRAVEYANDVYIFNFNDFVGNENDAGKIFANRLGAFFSLAHIILSQNGAAFEKGAGIDGFFQRLKRQKIDDYDTITLEEKKEIDEYFRMFGYIWKEKFDPGWIYQIRDSVGASLFLFDKKAFTKDKSELEKIDVGEIFLDPKNHWDKSGIGTARNCRMDNFVKKILAVKHEERQNVSSTKEMFMARIYNALTASQNLL